MSNESEERDIRGYMPTAEQIAGELAGVEWTDDFFGREGVLARLFGKALEQMLEGELSVHRGYERYDAKGRNSGNSRNGRYPKKVRTSARESTISVPRDQQATFEPQVLKHQEHNTRELEDKIIAMYAKGVSVRDIEDQLRDLYRVDVSPAMISTITDKVWPLVEAWQSRPLAPIYPIVYLDTLMIKIRQKSRVENVAVYNVMGVDLEGHRDVMGHWVSDGAEGANFWLKVLTDLQNRGVQKMFSSPAWMAWRALKMRSRPYSLSLACNAASCIKFAACLAHKKGLLTLCANKPFCHISNCSSTVASTRTAVTSVDA